MKIIQGFVTIPELADNTVNKVAKFGEFSTTAETFTRDLRNYSNVDVYPHIEVYTVKAVDENSSTIDIPQVIINRMLEVSNWIYSQFDKSSIPTNSSKTTLEGAIEEELKHTFAVKIGEIMGTGISNKRLVDYIRFDTTYENETYRLTLWFSESRFKTQYRYYEIEVIPPLDDIDRLIGTLPEVAVALNGVRLRSITKRINEQNRKAKITEIQTMSVDWFEPDSNPEEDNEALHTDWTLLIYGTAGADTEAMKGAIRDYLYQNSDYDGWPNIFPNLFSSNEFIIVPLWDHVATPEATYDDGQYTTWTSMGFISEAQKRYFPSSYKLGKHSDNYVASYTTVGSVFYRSMMMLSLGNPANKDGMYSIQHMFSDYMAVSTQSPDFGRMEPRTQEFVLKLNDCFNKARLYTPYERFPDGYTLTVKGGRDYIGFDYEGFTFYVMTRSGYLRDI